MNERRRKRRVSIRLTGTQWAVIVEALGQMVKIHASRLDSLVQADAPGSTGNVSAFDALSRTYADLLRELAQAGLVDPSARAAAETLDEASAMLESRISGGGRQ
ncbi:MAG: hypothetical protein HZB55_13390 [Deltaproteobacteria bacterium]|nr:hypothetical protein [Deltaproteobacteria bacterium]